MPTLNEEQYLRAIDDTGFTGRATLNEIAIRAIQQVDPSAKGSINEIEHLAWDAVMVPPGSWNERATFELFRAGFRGSLNEKQWQFYRTDPPSFTGPNIADVLAVDGAVLTPINVSSRFSGDQLQYELLGTWPPGVTINAAGVISGTVGGGAASYTGCRVGAENVVGAAQSNAFNVDVSAPGP